MDSAALAGVVCFQIVIVRYWKQWELFPFTCLSEVCWAGSQARLADSLWRKCHMNCVNWHTRSILWCTVLFKADPKCFSSFSKAQKDPGSVRALQYLSGIALPTFPSILSLNNCNSSAAWNFVVRQMDQIQAKVYWLLIVSLMLSHCVGMGTYLNFTFWLAQLINSELSLASC